MTHKEKIQTEVSTTLFINTTGKLCQDTAAGSVLVQGIFHGPLLKLTSSGLDFFQFFGEQPPGDLPRQH